MASSRRFYCQIITSQGARACLALCSQLTVRAWYSWVSLLLMRSSYARVVLDFFSELLFEGVRRIDQTVSVLEGEWVLAQYEK